VKARTVPPLHARAPLAAALDRRGKPKPASSSIARAARRSPTFISRTSRDAARRPSCSPATRPDVSPPTSPSCRGWAGNRNPERTFGVEGLRRGRSPIPKAPTFPSKSPAKCSSSRRGFSFVAYALAGLFSLWKTKRFGLVRPKSGRVFSLSRRRRAVCPSYATPVRSPTL
jgi:hypothetical protein